MELSPERDIPFPALAPPIAEIEATGVKVESAMLRTANLAEEELAPPSRKSSAGLLGYNTPDPSSVHFEEPLPDPGHADHDGAEPPDIRQRLPVFVVAEATTPVVAVPYNTALFPVKLSSVRFWPEAMVAPVLNVARPENVVLFKKEVAFARVIFPDPELSKISPVVAPPKVNVCPFVVPRLPVPVK